MKRFLCLVFLLVGIFLMPQTASAQAGYPDGFRVNSMSAVYRLQSNGSIEVNETIGVTFDQQRRGIFRDIPNSYERNFPRPDVDLNVQILEVLNLDLSRPLDFETQPIQFETSDVNGFKRVRIGDPDSFANQQEVYIIRYTLDNVIRHFDDHDELFLDVNGVGWNAQFDAVAATVLFPEGAVLKDQKCFTGALNSTDDDCTIEGIEAAQERLIDTNRPLNPYENLSFAISFEKGFFEEPGFWQQYGPVIAGNSGILLVVPAFIYLYRRWLRNGKDFPKGSIGVAFDPPESLTPAEIGTLADYNAGNQDVSATIVDLAIRGYLKIIDETKSEKAKKRKLSFELLNADWHDLKKHEHQIVSGIFSKQEVGEVVVLKSLKNKFHTTLDAVKKDLYETMTAEGYFAKNPKKARTNQIVTGVLIAVFSFIGGAASGLVASYPLTFIGLILVGVMTAIFGGFMPKRTLKGHQAWKQIEGLKKYLGVAEKERLAMLQSPGSQYARKGGGEIFTVDLYEKLLPFASVLGVEKAWSKQFENVYSQPPDWYQGNFRTFNAYMLGNTLSNSVNTIGSTMASQPSSSSGSGFSGGSSGGGFGGGGGGSW